MKQRSMIKIIITMVMILAITGLMMSSVFAQRSDENFVRGIDNVVSNIKTSTLSAEETEGLLLMREEEKLARDVYNALYEKWNLKTFESIGLGSETTHMDAIKNLLDRYGLEDPV